MLNPTYNACEWYPHLIKNDIPTIPSIILETDNIYSIKSDINKNLKQYPFVRLCNGSPKDYHNSCLFNDAGKVIEALENSNRTWFMLHPKKSDHSICVFMREYTKIDYEVRCFFNDGLRAVSCNYCEEDINKLDFESLVIDFFDIYTDKLPYQQATIDLGINADFDNAFIIEFNSFGIDSKAGAELFDWNEDYYDLYHSDKPIFCYKKTFEW